MRMGPLSLLVTTLASVQISTASSHILVSEPGEEAAIPGWALSSSSDIKTDAIASLSKPGETDTSSWHQISVSKCTLMACLLEIGVYNDQELWFSDNLESFDWAQFTVPWVYRSEFGLKPSHGRHFFLQTHGITSRGDIFLNGEPVANKSVQSGAYAGHEFDITHLVAEDNALLILVYPTNYYHDLALGFIDWNPNPPDNGTGIWRDVVIRQTGPVSLGPLTALVAIEPAHVSLRSTAENIEDRKAEISATAVIKEPNGGRKYVLEKTITLEPGESRVIEFNQTFDDPEIWWPRQWGDQPLYSAELSISTAAHSGVSDSVNGTFGLRSVTSKVNKDDDRVFTVNGHPFQVIGSGYSADMFLRFDPEYFETIVQYMLDMGLNTIRLEGKNEHPELYEIADRYGLMVMAGWECCNKWETWKHNEDVAADPPDYWDAADYRDARAAAKHEGHMLQTHPSMLAFLVGSDYWPDDRATDIYADEFWDVGLQIPIVASASKRGYPERLGPSGMKMEGPYDWVPPNYWYETEPSEDRYGAAFGFGSELGAGVGTPEIGSLRKFLTKGDMDDLWKRPEKRLYHMSTNVSQFYNRNIYNEGLYRRYGKPTSLEDYLRKAQMMDYEATRAEHEAFASRWSTGRVATGLVYWMLNSAWPSLHWSQFDKYLHPGGSYFGSKTGARAEHVAYNYVDRDVWVINRSLSRSGRRVIEAEVVDLGGRRVAGDKFEVETKPNKSSRVGAVPGLQNTSTADAVFLRLVLCDSGDGEDEVVSRNVYWIPPTVDRLNWTASTWYHTPVDGYADLTSLFSMDEAHVNTLAARTSTTKDATERDGASYTVTLENTSTVPAFFIRLNLVDADGGDVTPVIWSDNYVTLWPGETMKLRVDDGKGAGAAVLVDGVNVGGHTVVL
ncbi:exo-1,4-beta-D-glucosaminidase [Geosmithia morbida]|uniref:Exo-1,4-beta-D-glucosaminidase n=1 Tax=Geosmithia morbida TaxID=1094350 RepID=A0A9P5D3A6_9HYPO|nr:exo-1,4-beta-D-glucosaminidase [Geosmithia morbida]KAF4124727.1 exo-1,4-beta-D-glucosaminidase [Geosmithia morbida]